MNDLPKAKTNEQVIAPFLDGSLKPQKPNVFGDFFFNSNDVGFHRYTYIAIATWICSIALMMVASLFVRHAKMREYFIGMTLFGFAFGLIFMVGFGFGFYKISGVLLKRFDKKWIHRTRLAVSLCPIWGFALLIVIGIFTERMAGPQATLHSVTNGTVSINEAEDLRDNKRAGMKCQYNTVYFQTTPEVVERLLKQREYQKKWPLPEENLDYFSKEEISGQLQELIKSSIGTLPEDWPDPKEWDGVEVFYLEEENPHSRPGSCFCYCLITDKVHRQVILEYDDICP